MVLRAVLRLVCGIWRQVKFVGGYHEVTSLISSERQSEICTGATTLSRRLVRWRRQPPRMRCSGLSYEAVRLIGERN